MLTVDLAYAQSAIAVAAAAVPSSSPGLLSPALGPSQSQVPHSPILGQLSAVVILVEFQDLRHQRPVSDIQQLVFKDLAQYWHDVSYGKVTLTGKVVGWVTASQTYASYLASDSPQTEYSLILDAVNQVGSQVDFRQYGYVIVVHAGQDRSYTLNKNDLETTASIGTGTLTTKSGQVTVGVSLLAEFDPLGPYAHNLGLNFGLPDLWDYNILNSACAYCDDFVGEWDVMAHGFWANNGSTPVQPSVWSKIQLGWLDASQVVTAAASGGITTAENLTVTPLDTPGGVKALKFPVTSTTYYLVEVRRRVGWDLYIPDEGVVIYYVNSGLVVGGYLGSGLGPVRLQPSHDMGRAAWKVGQAFLGSKGGVGVYVASQGSDFSFQVDYAVDLTSSSFTLTVNALPHIAVTVDGRSFSTAVDGRLVLANQTWGVHNVSVQDAVAVSDGARLGFAGWADGIAAASRMVLMYRDWSLTANYKPQYLLSVLSPLPVEGGGWHDANTTVSVNVKQPTTDFGNGTRQVFTGWTGDATGTGNAVTIFMSGPKKVVANWKTQFYLITDSAYGTPSGAGWYDAGATVAVSVQPIVPIMLGEREVFTGWAGDVSVSNSSPNFTLQLTSPMRVSASWKTQHLIQIIVVDSHGMPVSSPPPQVDLTNGPSFSADGGRVWIDSGSYGLRQLSWFGISVKPDITSIYATSPNAVWKIPAAVFSVRVALKGMLTGLPGDGAVVTVRFPDGETVSATVIKGAATILQVPAGQYAGILSAGFITKSFQLNVAGDVNTSFTMLVPTELLIIIVASASFGAVLFLRWRRLPAETAVSPFHHGDGSPLLGVADEEFAVIIE